MQWATWIHDISLETQRPEAFDLDSMFDQKATCCLKSCSSTLRQMKAGGEPKLGTDDTDPGAPIAPSARRPNDRAEPPTKH